MSLLIKNNNKKSSLSLTSTKTKTTIATGLTRTKAITLHKYPTIKAATTTNTTTSAPLLSPSSVVEASSNIDAVSSSTSSAKISLFSLIEHPVELEKLTTATSSAALEKSGSGRKVFRTMPSFKIMSYQNFIALLTVLVCGLVTVNGLKCYMCGQYNEGVGSITPCLNYSEQYAHLYLKECSKKSEKYCVKYVSELSIVRDCATECAEKEIWETQTYCCTEDGCNGSNTIEASAYVIMLPLFIYIVNEIMNIIKQQRR
ncbi:uncharacterized protein LOC111690571 [Lucilia cuprina]|uniref:uncharacterized protein LOC111690571 n=1 Tax=Lucilia cuprina TaxID=7375 RepID=UPI001F053BEE|nr:uncharacterized protein LOC111690571 [Lucilia cuprina]XP_046805651.1 uncharacterized protein LOC111690571 [Lucilia cuprina]